MAPSQGSFIRITDFQTLENQQVLNVYYYRAADNILLGTGAEQTGEEWWNHVKAQLRAIQSTFLLHQFIRVEQIGDPLYYGEYQIPAGEQAGTNTASTGNETPTFLAAGILLRRGNATVKSGAKRIAGLKEEDVGDYGLLSTAYKADVQAFADRLVLPFSASGTLPVDAYDHYIVRLAADGLSIVQSAPVTGVLVKDYATTQNSRKIGRGA